MQLPQVFNFSPIPILSFTQYLFALKRSFKSHYSTDLIFLFQALFRTIHLIVLESF
jgi:hypothetical protein